MPDWLQDPLGIEVNGSVGELFVRLGLAFLFGGVIAGVYRLTHARPAELAPGFLTTLVLLSILIALVTQVIGNSVARAFSLVGALSIVRFRTVVEDTRDTAFVIFAVTVGMAVGAGQPLGALVGLAVVGTAAVLVRPRRRAPVVVAAAWSLVLRVGLGQGPDALFATTFAKHLEGHDLLSAATGRQGAALDLTYTVRLRPDTTPTVLVAELNRLDGVQSVELRRL